MESELSGLEDADKQDFLSALGVTDEDCGLKVKIQFCRYNNIDVLSTSTVAI